MQDGATLWGVSGRACSIRILLSESQEWKEDAGVGLLIAQRKAYSFVDPGVRGMTNTHTYTRIYIHIHMYVCTRTYLLIYLHTYLHTYYVDSICVLQYNCYDVVFIKRLLAGARHSRLHALHDMAFMVPAGMLSFGGFGA